MSFAKTLRALREARGWSQQYVADRIGVHKMTISHYESGKIHPRFDLIEALTALFRVDMNYLMGFSDTITRPSGDTTDDVDFPHKPAVTLAEIDLIEAYRHATPDTQAAIRAILHLEG